MGRRKTVRVFVVSVYGERREEEVEGGGVKNIPKHPPHPQLLCRPQTQRQEAEITGIKSQTAPLCCSVTQRCIAMLLLNPTTRTHARAHTRR